MTLVLETILLPTVSQPLVRSNVFNGLTPTSFLFIFDIYKHHHKRSKNIRWQLPTKIWTLDLSRKIKHGIDWDTVMVFIDLLCKPGYSSSKQSCWIHACVNVWICGMTLGRLLLRGFSSRDYCEHESTIIFGPTLSRFLKCPNASQIFLKKNTKICSSVGAF